MASFVNYLLESGISLSLFALGYFLFLRSETFFRVNRWFLLISIVFSAVLPLLRIPFYVPQATMLGEVTVTPYINLLNTVTVYSSSLSVEAERFVLTYSMFGYLYLFGILFFFVKFLVQIFQVSRLIALNPVIPEGKIKLVILERELSPFSFLNYVFVSKNLRSTNGWEKMFEHEKQHVRQGHTFDVLVLEIIAVFQWFNPFFWMFRRALRENHEFQADRAVISQGTAPSRYKQILLNQYVGEQLILTNNFNYSLVKNRIKMISKIKSRKIANAKVLVGMVLAAILIAVFACEQKQSVTTEMTSAGKSITLVAEGHPLQVTGDSVGIEKLKSILSASDDYEMKPGPSAGQLALVKKCNHVTEMSVVGYGAAEKSGTVQEEVYNEVEQMPVFSGGEMAFRKFLAMSVKYPPEAVKKGIQGKVLVSFIIGKDGSVYNSKIVKSVDPMLDAEALRVVNSMPKWTPGQQGGKVVAVQFTVPINFVLQ